jgi:hypothetical protein
MKKGKIQMAEENVERTVVEVRKDVQTRQVKGGHVVILTQRTFFSDGGNATVQEDCGAETGTKASALIAEFLGA